MLVALRSFTDPTDGQPIRAGSTYVAEDAEVALMFPERFKQASGRSGEGSVRRSGRRRKPASRRWALPVPDWYLKP